MKNTLSKKIKAVVAAVGCLAMAVLPSMSAVAEETLIGYKGDLNGDLSVNSADAVLLACHLLGKAPLSSDYSIYADANSDNVIDVFDLIIFRQYLTGAREIEGIYGSSDDWTPPTIDEIRDDENRRISEEDYNKLMEAVEMFGIEKYKIIHTYDDIDYSIVIPNWSFASSYSIEEKAYQLIPSWPHVKEDFIYDYQFYLEALETEENVDEGLKYEFVYTVWRPLSVDEDKVIIEFDTGEVVELDYKSVQFYDDESWIRSDWILIPLDDDGNQIMEVLKND